MTTSSTDIIAYPKIFVISEKNLSNWQPIYALAREATKHSTDVYEIAHFTDEHSLMRSLDVLNTTTDKSHKFLLYKDFHLHPKIDEILNAVYDYKMRNSITVYYFIEALLKTNKWVPPVPWKHAVYSDTPRYKQFFLPRQRP